MTVGAKAGSGRSGTWVAGRASIEFDADSVDPGHGKVQAGRETAADRQQECGIVRRFEIAAILLVLGGCESAPPRTPADRPTLASALDQEAALRGRAIALIGCASCHAVDAAGPSPLPAATPFRDIVRRRSLSDIEAAMADGLVTTHPAMPRYDFRAAEIDDLIAYMDTLKRRPTTRRP